MLKNNDIFTRPKRLIISHPSKGVQPSRLSAQQLFFRDSCNIYSLTEIRNCDSYLCIFMSLQCLLSLLNSQRSLQGKTRVSEKYFVAFYAVFILFEILNTVFFTKILVPQIQQAKWTFCFRVEWNSKILKKATKKVIQT